MQPTLVQYDAPGFGIGTVRKIAANATRIGLLVRDGDVFRLANPLPSYAASLARLLEELERLHG